MGGGAARVGTISPRGSRLPWHKDHVNSHTEMCLFTELMYTPAKAAQGDLALDPSEIDF